MLLVADICCDIFYAILPIGILLSKFLSGAIARDRIDSFCERTNGFTVGCNSVGFYTFYREVRVTFWGGPNAWVVLLKLKSRLLPLITASLKIKTAFDISI